MENEFDKLKLYFLDVILPNATKLQSWDDTTNSMGNTASEEEAEKLLRNCYSVLKMCHRYESYTELSPL